MKITLNRERSVPRAPAELAGLSIAPSITICNRFRVPRERCVPLMQIPSPSREREGFGLQV